MSRYEDLLYGGGIYDAYKSAWDGLNWLLNSNKGKPVLPGNGLTGGQTAPVPKKSAPKFPPGPAPDAGDANDGGGHLPQTSPIIQSTQNPEPPSKDPQETPKADEPSVTEEPTSPRDPVTDDTDVRPQTDQEKAKALNYLDHYKIDLIDSKRFFDSADDKPETDQPVIGSDKKIDGTPTNAPNSGANGESWSALNAQARAEKPSQVNTTGKNQADATDGSSESADLADNDRALSWNNERARLAARSAFLDAGPGVGPRALIARRDAAVGIERGNGTISYMRDGKKHTIDANSKDARQIAWDATGGQNVMERFKVQSDENGGKPGAPDVVGLDQTVNFDTHAPNGVKLEDQVWSETAHGLVPRK